MIAVHTLETFANPAVQNTLFGKLINLLGGPPAAPIFMFLLGVGIVYSRKSDPGSLFNRGWLLLVAGYLLNLLRGTIPCLIRYLNTGDLAIWQAAFSNLIAIDIFQFAGLSFIFFSLVRRFNIRSAGLVVFWLLCCGLNHWLANIQVQGYLSIVLTGLFWGSSLNSYFPFLDWIAYPIAGYIFAQILITSSDKKGFYSRLLAGSFVALVVAYYLFAVVWKMHFGLIAISNEYAYYQQKIFSNILLIAFCLLWISLLYYVSPYVSGLLKRTIERWSRNVSIIYYIQWLLIGWLTIPLGQDNQPLMSTRLLIIVLIVASDLFASLYVQLKSRQSLTKKMRFDHEKI